MNSEFSSYFTNIQFKNDFMILVLLLILNVLLCIFDKEQYPLFNKNTL